MRIISGINKGMKLISPVSNLVRPTIDRIKEAAFNIMQFSLENAVFLDMFSGSGQMGIEAIARGAACAWFCDISTDSLKTIRENLKKTGFENKAQIRNGYASILSVTPKPKFDLVYIDPPYEENLFEPALKFLTENELVADGGIIIVETPKGVKLPESIGFFNSKVKSYGQISLTVYKDEREL